MLKERGGQVMILTVLALGGAVLSATTVAGLLMLYQIRQTTDMANSAKSIFAADAGTELTLYNLFCSADASKVPCPRDPLPKFSNNATVAVTCGDASGAPVDCLDQSLTSIKSVGSAGGANRALLTTF